MTGTENTNSDPGPDAGVEELRADIEDTREQLGETVSALGAKFDLSGRAENKVAAVKTTVVTTAHNVTENARAYPAVPAVLAAAVAALFITVALVRRRR